MYYRNKIDSLQKIFGTTDLELVENGLRVRDRTFLIRDDVIDLTPTRSGPSEEFAADIQHTFGEEWKTYGHVLPEHRKEFAQYFDLVNVEQLRNDVVCDMGCGSGRWATFVQPKCRELVLIDFSDAIYVARKNLRQAPNCIF